MKQDESVALTKRGILCSPFKRDLTMFWKDILKMPYFPRVIVDKDLGYTLPVSGDSYRDAILKGALLFPCKVKLAPLFQAKIIADAAYKPNNPLVMSVGKSTETIDPPAGHNEYEIGVKLSDGYRYPSFPYYPEDQAFLVGPNYEKVADALLDVCYRHELIAGAAKNKQGVHIVWEIYFCDGSVMNLSDMQTMLVLQGLLKGFKRLVEIDEEIRPALEERLTIKKMDSWRPPSGTLMVAHETGVPPSVRPAPRRTTGGRKTGGSPTRTPQLPPEAMKLLNAFRNIPTVSAVEESDDDFLGMLDDKPKAKNASVASTPVSQPAKSAFDDDDLSALLDM